MSIKRITAIVSIDFLPSLEKYLRQSGVPGVTVERVAGYGRHPNFFRQDLMKENARVLLFAAEEQVDSIIEAISNCARQTGLTCGVVTVEHVERLFKLTNEGAVIAAP